jgi:hypothetical protein
MLCCGGMILHMHMDCRRSTGISARPQGAYYMCWPRRGSRSLHLRECTSACTRYTACLTARSTCLQKDYSKCLALISCTYAMQPIDVLGGMLGGVAVLNFYITVDGAQCSL